MLLSRVDVVFCFGNYLWYSPIYKQLLIYFILETILLVAISGTPPVDTSFLIHFSSVFVGCFFEYQFPVFPRFQTFSC